MPLKPLLACLVAALALACGGSSPDSQGPTPPGSGGAAGGPKLAWDQLAPSADELRRYSYVLYVDGTPVALTGATCGTLAAETVTAACTSPLPTMSPGQHTLEMATRVTDNGIVLESAKSAAIVYTVGSTTSGSVTQGAQASAVGSASERPYVVETVVTGLDRPSALAKLPDGRLLIAGRGGAIRMAEAGALLPEPAALLPDADPAADAVVSLAVAPDFAASRHVYVGYGAVDAQGARTGRVVRFREAGGVLGEGAVILDGLPAALAAPWVAIGPDGTLYVGTSAGDDAEAANVGSYAGKVLRFGLDGSTPADNPVASSPVFSSGYGRVLGIDSDRGTGRLWVLETDDAGAALALAVPGAPGTRVVGLGPTGPGRMAFLSAGAAGAPASWRGGLLVAAPDERCLLRISWVSAPRSTPIIERLLQDEFGRIALVLTADDGIYIGTANGGAGEDARLADVVYRVRERVGSSPWRRESP